jgi:dihydrofolate synthase/folylpolyglutamate synthase
MDYKEVIHYLYDMLPMYQRMGNIAFKKDLTNTKKLCEHLGHPEKSFKSIHVAGTNGKGSSSHMLAAILKQTGYKTGLYTSPHLKHFNERIKVNGIPVGEDFIVDFVNTYRKTIERIKPSFFELTVVMAFDYFSREKVDFAVIEVGLGGRLDSTNVIRPKLALITNISYDHQEMLGETLEEIAFEKGGIIKKQIPVIIGEKDSITSKVFKKIAKKRQAPLIYAKDKYEVLSLKRTVSGQEIEIHHLEQDSRSKLNLETPGLTQLKNIPGVLTVIDELNKFGYKVSGESVRWGLEHYQKNTGLKGRWQILNKKPLIIADIAHNKAGIENVMEQLEKLPREKLYCILGFMKEKDLGSIFPYLPVDAYYTFCQAKVPRAMDANWLALNAALYNINGEVVREVNAALSSVKEKAGEEDIIFIGGSTFVVAELDNL